MSSEVRPREVDLHVEVDPARGRRFRGEVEIRLHVERPRSTLELHAVDLRISRPRLEVDGALLRATALPRPARETVELRFAKRIPAGEATLRMGFAGALRDDLRGLYAASSGERRFAFSQLEPTDARRFFPCFDEPTMKARFRMTVTTAQLNAVVSNAPQEAVESRGDGRKTVRFAPTPPLSTYLVALAVGELEATPPALAGPTEIRVWHLPGKGHLTAFALETARETLTRLERYFGLPYPYAKLDLVAVPDFEAGAMENAGAVFFRETLLLVDPETVSQGERKRVAEVICHELAHMWYGDLVTMAWWDDLWLNEAFATWMAFQVVDDWKPGWKMWHDFEHLRAAALDLDALANTHPIYVDVRTPAEATANFDLITYEKGASVVRMIERYLGPGAFRRGVRRYIRRHREGNAVAADLWRALSEASGENVEPIVRAWIEQPGFPGVRLRRMQGRGRELVELRQERFTARPAGADSGQRLRWPVPWVGRVGGARSGSSRRVRRLLRRARERVDLGVRSPRFVYGNADEGGFFRPLHGRDELESLGRSLSALSPVERMGLLGHQWAAVRADRASLETFLDLAEGFGSETDPDVLALLRGPFAFVDQQLAPAAGTQAQAAFRDWLIQRFGQQLVDLGWDPAQDEDIDTRLRRAAVIGLLGETAEWEPVLAAADLRFERYLQDRGSLDSNLADAVVTLAARGADEARQAALVEAAASASTPQERRRFLFGLGAVTDRRLVDRSLRLTLTDAVPTQDVAFLLARLIANPGAGERAWEFVKARWPRLRRRMPPMLVTRLIEATPALQSAARRRDVAAFFRANPVPVGARALRQALERFALNAAFRRRAAPRLRAWLADRRESRAG